MSWLGRLFNGKAGVADHPAILVEPDFVVIDVETSCSRASSICQVGIVGFRDGAECFEFESLVDPKDDFHDFNVTIHGIEKSHVRGKPHFGQLHGALDKHLSGRKTVSHSSFDKGALSAACLHHGRPRIETQWYDSVQVARRAWPDLSSHKLGLLARHLDLPLKHHDALSDARAAGLVVVRAMEITGLTLDELSVPMAKPRAAGSVKREGTGDGPLAGECIAMTGDFALSKAEMADRIAAAGGAVSPSVTKKTTILVLGVQDPSSFAGKAKSAKHLKAEDAISQGQPVRIMAEADFVSLLA